MDSNRRGFGRLKDDFQGESIGMRTTSTVGDPGDTPPYWQQIQFSSTSDQQQQEVVTKGMERQISSESSCYDKSALNQSSPRKKDTAKPEGIRDLVSVIAMPVINVAGTSVLIAMLLYIYQHANGQSTDLTMAGMKVPTIISLMMTIVKMFVAGGIAYAISEYKWIRLQNDGGQLALLDIYDACTRGVGGIVRILTSIRADHVLLPAIIFQFGLMAMGPASQQILTTANNVQCDKEHTGVYYTNVSASDMTTMKTTSGAASVKGLEQDYLVRYAFGQAALGFQVQPYYDCPLNSINCTYTPILGYHTAVTCKNGSLNTQIVDLNRNNITTLSQYYGYDKADRRFPPMPNVPGIFYDGSMFGRTYFDLNNYTKPLDVSADNNATYDAQIRKFFGDQKFVVVTTDDGTLRSYLDSKKMPQVLECTLQSYLNTSTLIVEALSKRQQLLSQVPITFDFDALSNNTYWSDYYVGANFTQMNAYAMQLSILKNLIADGMDEFQEIVENWLYYGIPHGNTPAEFFANALHNVDLSAVYGLPINPIFGTKGTQCYNTGSFYQLNPAAFYGLSLSLLLPLGWWTVLWVISLHQTNGISRGNSQVALLVTGLTPAVREKLRGISHAGQKELFERAQKVDVVFGETRSTGHIAFGTPGEINPLRTRRYSF
ncbi:hypothetical protein BDB00DRAFT_943668 [Zychaea mexicana]|uniref:uncharacterized protein n=1 Tax=Zychaea mexicana TaxID=64656 RepID=UPI0022FF2C96|nr:uncharacterized protein BDB00DRAFT_943668 [Zychaea mexicana]KAI9472871.1 hypothetical protein BDB00DRAFT_943668 [Zychaea mexicana]